MVDPVTLQPKPGVELPKTFSFHGLRKMLQQMDHSMIIFYRFIMK
jgi:hypothetical protein